ncbi:hypothetical protein Q7P36_000028 [Cladosporium allicinum]
MGLGRPQPGEKITTRAPSVRSPDVTRFLVLNLTRLFFWNTMSAINAILHGQNSTAQPVWHPNPTYVYHFRFNCVLVATFRKTAVLSLTSTLEQTIFLCVWQAIHLNIAPPGEPQYKQLLRRVGWSILAIIAPELVALNAWLQYRRADKLMKNVNRVRGLTQKSSGPFLRRSWDRFSTHVGKEVFALLSAPDWLRMLFRHREEMLATKREKQQTDLIHLHTQLDKGILPWTIDIAFYAISGAVILEDDCENDLTLDDGNICFLAEHDAAALIQLQRAALQKPGKASVLAKMITCTQALWFCSQCIARLSQNMAISLVELNTFAHCISAFFIYAFWWHKPYDAEAHVYVDQPKLLQNYLRLEIQRGSLRPIDRQSCKLLDIFEETRDGRVSLDAESGWLDSSSLRFQYELTGTNLKNMPITINYGATIPGTGFTLFCSGETDGHCLRLSYHALECWKRLWRLRCNTMLRSQSNHVPRRYRSDYATPTEDSSGVRRRAKNMDREFLDSAFGDRGVMVPLILTSVFLVYGGLHLLAWQYNFQTNAEGIMWRAASIVTASSGLIILSSQTVDYLNTFRLYGLLDRLQSIFVRGLMCLCWFLMGVEFLARSFLVIESFRALPNSPSSVYEIPRWTAYLPHI